VSEPVPRKPSGVRGAVVAILTLLLTAFVLIEVNRPALTPQAQLAAFALFGLPLCFLIRMRPGDPWWRRGIDLSHREGIQIACAPDGTILTAYRNRNFRGLRPRRTMARTAWS